MMQAKLIEELTAETESLRAQLQEMRSAFESEQYTAYLYRRRLLEIDPIAQELLEGKGAGVDSASTPLKDNE